MFPIIFAKTNSNRIRYLLYDQFIDPNGTSLDAHTPNRAPVGVLWNEVRGDWDIQGNQANLVSTVGGIGQAVIDSGKSDIDISVIAKAIVNNDQPSITLRYVDVNNYLLINLDNPGNRIRIIQRLVGVLSVPYESAYTLTNGIDYVVEVIASGINIGIYVDGGLITNTTNANFLTATKHGLYAQVATAKFDEFQITSL